MKSSNTKKAVDKIAELTGVEISEDNLYLESIVTSNALHGSSIPDHWIRGSSERQHFRTP
ncbi:MAG: hypothetical protein O3B13_09710 [Planctomycetota bacterium]|nr:hypothetical protein [Planctomycetota bacterium]MDA1163365.1 hypothetical protein [Planctomycetota bacterium]